MNDKRKSQRKAILYTCMVKRIFLKEKLIRSRIVNYSDNGVMLESDVNFRVGDAITIYFSTELQREIKSFSDDPGKPCLKALSINGSKSSGAILAFGIFPFML